MPGIYRPTHIYKFTGFWKGKLLENCSLEDQVGNGRTAIRRILEKF
jgi:hypothetical protein